MPVFNRYLVIINIDLHTCLAIKLVIDCLKPYL